MGQHSSLICCARFDISPWSLAVGATLITTVTGAYIASRGLMNLEADPELAAMMMEEEAAGRRARLRPEDVMNMEENSNAPTVSSTSSSESSKKK